MKNRLASKTTTVCVSQSANEVMQIDWTIGWTQADCAEEKTIQGQMTAAAGALGGNRKKESFG